MQIDTDIFMKSFEDVEIAERSYGDILSGYMCRCYTCGLGYYGPKRSCTCKKCMSGDDKQYKCTCTTEGQKRICIDRGVCV